MLHLLQRASHEPDKALFAVSKQTRHGHASIAAYQASQGTCCHQCKPPIELDFVHDILADGAAPDGAALLGLGYNSDGDSQDSGRSPQSGTGQPGLVSSAEGAGASPAAEGGDEAYAEEGPNMSPSTAAGGWVTKEDDKKTIKPSFVKGQR